MQHDEVIWQLIGHHFCSYKIKAPDDGQHFCRNEYNVTGLCNRQACPLANSQYATIREIKGVCYLFMKTIERAHTPAHLWEKVKLSNNYEKSVSQIEKHLEFWPNFLMQKCKLRLKRIMQVLSKKRKLLLNGSHNSQLDTFKQKSERREKRREIKAEIAARLDKSIEKELLERLNTGLYGDIYNFPKKYFEKVMEKTGHVSEKDQLDMTGDDQNDYSNGHEDEEEDELDEYVEALSEDEELDSAEGEMEEDAYINEEFEESDEEIENTSIRQRHPPAHDKRSRHWEIEYEQEGDIVKSNRPLLVNTNKRK